MPKLKNMLGETGTVEIPVDGDDPLVVEYRRGVMTPRLQIRLMKLQRAISDLSTANPEDAADAIMAMCELYAQMIVAWNLTDDDGEVIATDQESLAELDFGLLQLVARSIGGETAPDPLSESGSSNGSSPTASSAPRPITTRS